MIARIISSLHVNKMLSLHCLHVHIHHRNLNKYVLHSDYLSITHGSKVAMYYYIGLSINMYHMNLEMYM